MQTLWARVAQAKGACRCPQCLSNAPGVSRRATATATRRMPKYVTSSTLWYSGIFAAAATFDASVKMRRREQWDIAIADVKKELEEPAHVPARAEEEFTIADAVQELQTYSPFGSQASQTNVFRDVDPHQPKPHWPTNTGADPYIHHLPPESIYATEERQQLLEKNMWTPKKTAAIHLAMEMFELDLLIAIRRRDWAKEAMAAVPSEFAKHFEVPRDELSGRLKRKKAVRESLAHAEQWLTDYEPAEDDIKICSFKTEQDAQDPAAIHDLNVSLQNIFELQAAGTLTEPAMLAQLAYNVATCPSTPNLNTFNTLLLGLSRLDDPAPTNCLIRRMRRAHVRLNEVTLAAVLRHFTKTEQSYRFVQWIGLMRGSGTGLALARPDIQITAAGHSRLRPRDCRPDRIIQLPYPTPYVFSAVIEGILKFAGFDSALEVWESMGAEGWGLCMSGMTPLLDDCAKRKDWKAGSAFWAQIQELKRRSTRTVGRFVQTERMKLETFAAMLKLCRRCDKKKDFDDVWYYAMRVHKDAEKTLARMVVEGLRSPEVVSSQRSDAAPPAGATMHADPSSSLGEQIEEPPAPSGFVVSDTATGNTNTPDIHDQHLQNTPNETLRSAGPAWQSDLQPLTREQLHGFWPAGAELEEYELGERPMTITRPAKS